MANDTIGIYKEWVKCADYQFKILVLASYLEDNSLCFKGTLDTMCQWLGIANAPKNTKQIKNAIEELEKKSYIFYKKEGQKHLISITKEGLKDKRIIKMRKSWIKSIKEYNIAKNGKVNRNWDTMLKGLTIILSKIDEEEAEGIGNGKSIIIKMRELAEDIDKCEATAGKITTDLSKCQFEEGFKIEKVVLRDKVNINGKEEIRSKGTYIKATYSWED